MATSTHGDIYPGSRRVGMMLHCLSAHEVRIPPKSVIDNIQTTEVVPNMKALDWMCKILPSEKQKESSWVGQPTCLNSPKNELIWPTPISLQFEPGVMALEHNVLNKVNLLGCIEWNPEDQQEVKKILRLFADIFAKDNLDLGQTSVGKHKFTLKARATPIKECFRRLPPGLYDEV